MRQSFSMETPQSGELPLHRVGWNSKFQGVAGKRGGEGRGACGARMAEHRRDRGIIIPGTMCPGR